MSDALTKKELLEDEPEGYEFDDSDNGSESEEPEVDKKAEAMKQFEKMTANPPTEETSAESTEEIPEAETTTDNPPEEEANETPEDGSEDNVMTFAEKNPRGKPPGDSTARVLPTGGGKEGTSPKWVLQGDDGYESALPPAPKAEKAAAAPRKAVKAVSKSDKMAAPKKVAAKSTNGVDFATLYAEVQGLKNSIEEHEEAINGYRVELDEKKTQLAESVSDL